MPAASAAWSLLKPATGAVTLSAKAMSATSSLGPSPLTKAIAACFAPSSGAPAMLPDVSIASTTLSLMFASCTLCASATGMAAVPSAAVNCAAWRPGTGMPLASSTVTTALSFG